MDAFKCTQNITIRWGGDEFVSVAGANDENELNLLLRTLCENTRSNCIDEIYWVSISIGCYVLQNDRLRSASLEQYINYADKALYDAKLRGKDCFEITGI